MFHEYTKLKKASLKLKLYLLKKETPLKLNNKNILTFIVFLIYISIMLCESKIKIK